MQSWANRCFMGSLTLVLTKRTSTLLSVSILVRYMSKALKLLIVIFGFSRECYDLFRKEQA